MVSGGTGRRLPCERPPGAVEPRPYILLARAHTAAANGYVHALRTTSRCSLSHAAMPAVRVAGPHPAHPSPNLLPTPISSLKQPLPSSPP